MEPDKIGGQISLDIKMKQGPKERRNKYPCRMCTKFNTSYCDLCKCDSCQVPEEKCPQCKNRPQHTSQYQVLHGSPQEGENWESADIFTCARCYKTWKVKWDHLPKYDKCPHCNTVYYLYPYFTGQYKGCLRGSQRAGFNWEKQDIFKCPTCNAYFYVEQARLPGKGTCQCGRTYYCYKSPEKKKRFL